MRARRSAVRPRFGPPSGPSRAYSRAYRPTGRAPRRTACAAGRSRRAPATQRRTSRRPASRRARRSVRSASHKWPGRPIASSIRLSSDRPPKELVEQAGEDQVVLRQQQRVGESHQDLRRQLMGRRQAIQARDWHTMGLQCPHQGAGPRNRPPSRQDHHVAGGEWPALAFQHHPAARLIGDPWCQRLRQMLWRRCQALICSGTLPGQGIGDVGQRRERPQFHRACDTLIAWQLRIRTPWVYGTCGITPVRCWRGSGTERRST